MMQKLLVILFAVCLWTVPALAQQEQPDQGFILGTDSEVIFPQAIRFHLITSRPLSELASATLAIQPEGETPTVMDVDLETAATRREPYAEFDYLWTIPSANPPHLFRKINYIWRVISNDDETAQFENTLDFTDQRAQWVQQINDTGNLSLTIPVVIPVSESIAASQATEQSPLTPQTQATAGTSVESNLAGPTATPGGIEAVTPQIAFTPSGPLPTIDASESNGIAQMLVNLQPVYDLLATNTGRKPSLNLLVYPESLLPGCTTNDEEQSVAVAPVSGTEVPCDNSIANSIFGASGYELVQSDSNNLSRIQIAIINRLVDIFYEAAWQGKDVPAWFRLGLQQFYSPVLKSAYYPMLLNAARNDTLLPLDQVGSAIADSDLSAAQSYGLTLYLADQLGLDGLYRLANVDAESFADAYQSVTGKPLSSLLDDWKRWIFTNPAASAFSFTAYQATTPTPTATRTPRPPLPTLTPTPTSTWTPTITPTVTGTLSATPPPPTRTPSPAPPTLTPRPAGSLTTPTPMPSQAANPLSNLSAPTAAMGILTIGLVLVAIFALLMLRGRSNK